MMKLNGRIKRSKISLNKFLTLFVVEKLSIYQEPEQVFNLPVNEIHILIKLFDVSKAS